jgi:hypothetical protein
MLPHSLLEHRDAGGPGILRSMSRKPQFGQFLIPDYASIRMNGHLGRMTGHLGRMTGHFGRMNGHFGSPTRHFGLRSQAMPPPTVDRASEASRSARRGARGDAQV